MTNDDHQRADLHAACGHLRMLLKNGTRQRDAFGTVAAAGHGRLLPIAIAILESSNPLDRHHMRFAVTAADLLYAMDVAARRYGAHPALCILDVHASRNRSHEARVAARLARDTLNMNPNFRRWQHANDSQR